MKSDNTEIKAIGVKIALQQVHSKNVFNIATLLEFQAPQSRGGLSSRRGLLAGAAGGALAGGLLGFGMGHAVGGWGDSFDGDCCDFDCD